MSNPVIFAMGEGKVLAGTAILEGKPCLVFAPAANPGMVGENANHEMIDGQPPPGGFVLQFTTAQSVLQHMDRVKEMVELYSRVALGGQGEQV